MGWWSPSESWPRDDVHVLTFRRMHHRRIPQLVLFGSLCAALSCTDAGLYATNGSGPSAPDRAEFAGQVCVPISAGDAFPVRVVYAVPGGDGVPVEVSSQVIAALDSLKSRFSFPWIQFSAVAYHSVATGLVGSFVKADQLQDAISAYNRYNEVGPVSLRAPLRFAHTVISGEMQTGCGGMVARSRYLVVLVVTGKDTSCANPHLNVGIESECGLDPATCSECELTATVSRLKKLVQTYGAGEVSIQPVYVRTTQDPAISAQVAAIARAGGTQPIETDPNGLQAALNALDYASLQRDLRLKRVIAFNRSALARRGELLVDSDGDGLSDEDEIARGTNPLLADTDGDLLMDGVEVKMGMDPLVFDTVTGCNGYLDSDGDRLNDCEERVLGTESCMSDTDGDSLPDLVELLSGTNPLVAEDLADDDRDGFTNISEVEAHTDPLSADIAFRSDRGIGYAVVEGERTVDGRQCYDLRVRNVGLVGTQARSNAPYPDTPAGMNDIYLYFQVGRESEARATGPGSLSIQQVQFVPPASRTPSGVIELLDQDFIPGF